jgi:hypothetical protein
MLNRPALLGLVLLLVPGLANASVIFDTWVSNEDPNGNYVLTITPFATGFTVDLEIDPWNAEALGLFLDLGAVDISSASILGAPPDVSVFDTDATSNKCGPGCNLNGLTPPLGDDGEWEFVFQLGGPGFDGRQNWSFDVSAAGQSFTEGDFVIAAIRAQALCSEGDTLPTGNCNDSDKSYGYASVPEPSTLALLGIGLLAIGAVRLRRKGEGTNGQPERPGSC